MNKGLPTNAWRILSEEREHALQIACAQPKYAKRLSDGLELILGYIAADNRATQGFGVRWGSGRLRSPAPVARCYNRRGP